MDQQKRSFTILAWAQAALGAALALVIFALYSLRPSSLSDPGVSLVVAGFGVMTVLYYFGIHWWLSKRSLQLSTLILTGITAVNLIFIIANTGGLDSPYYAFWLLLIVAVGTFGTVDTIVILALTVAYYLLAIGKHGFDGQYALVHLPQLALSLLAGGLSEAIQRRTRHASTQTAAVSTLEGQLTQEQLKAQVLMNSMAEGVLVVDAQRRIQLFNPAAQTITGWDEASAQNIDYGTVLNLKTADDQPLDQNTDPLPRAWQARHNLTVDNLTMTTRSGRKVPIFLSISPILDEDTKVTGAIALFRDISAEKEVARQRDEFVSTASHEMRTPLAAIEGYISLALNPNGATIDDRAHNYLTKAHDAITHLGELFKDLLSVTKAEEGLLQSPLEPVNFTKLVEAAFDDMKLIAKQKSLSLIFQPTESSSKSLTPTFWVLANDERLREVVMNLIENAIKFTPHGTITITLGINSEKDVVFAVTDSGIGIPAEDIPHLFQKFYRVDNSATRTIGGTGLGLYLGRTLMELFNGRIWAESTLGKGSTFSISLPRLSEAEVEQRKEAAQATILPDAVADIGPPPPAVPLPSTPPSSVSPAPVAPAVKT